MKFTTSTAIPSTGVIVATLHSSWDFTPQTVCTATGLSALTGNSITSSGPTSGQVLTLSNFSLVTATSAIDIQCTYVKATTATAN